MGPVSSPDDLARQAEAVARVRLARTRRDESADALRTEIVRAYRLGASVRDIAAAAEVSRQWVWRVVRDAQSGE